MWRQFIQLILAFSIITKIIIYCTPEAWLFRRWYFFCPKEQEVRQVHYISRFAHANKKFTNQIEAYFAKYK